MAATANTTANTEVYTRYPNTEGLPGGYTFRQMLTKAQALTRKTGGKRFAVTFDTQGGEKYFAIVRVSA